MPIQSLTTSFSSIKLIPEDTVKIFWEIEELPHSHHFTKEKQTSKEHFQKTTKCNQDGLFVVKLPFKENTTSLDDSFQQQAKRRLNTLLQRLIRDKSLRQIRSLHQRFPVSGTQ